VEIKFLDPELLQVTPEKIVARITEENGTRTLGIALNNISTALIAWEINEVDNRPTIFKFTLECIQALQANIERVVIHDLIDHYFQAHAVLKDDGADRTYNINLHVTDALALAVAAKCPLFVDEVVFTKTNKHTNDPISADALRKFEGITTSDNSTKH